MTLLARLTAAMLPVILCSWTALAADPVANLSGYWSGNGSIALSNGKTERVKCNVLYRSEGGSQIKQTLRCASEGYSIHSQADLRLAGGQVSGTWEEKTYAAKGDVSGHYGGDTFKLSIQGATFTAAMHVTLSSCKQSLSITPQGLEVTRVSISLSKDGCGE
jgi:hypothetical protein